MVPNAWEQKAAMVLAQGGTLRLTGLRDTSECVSISGVLVGFLCKQGNGLSRYPLLSKLVSPPNMPQYYVQRKLTMIPRHNEQYLVVEVDVGYHSLSYWLDRARVYLTDTRVYRVLIVQFFPLRQSAFVAGQYKRAAVAVVLGRVATAKKQVSMGQQQATSDYDVCILDAKSFGNAPLATNIREILNTMRSPAVAASRGELHFDEPAYAAVPIPLSAVRDGHFEILEIGVQHPHLLSIVTETNEQPWVVNLGEIFTAGCEGWMRDQERRVR